MYRLIVLLLLLPLVAVAQRVDTLSEARVTSFRAQSNLSVSEFRLDSAALLRQGVSSLSDALQRLPGVALRDYGGAGGLKTVSVRGMGTAHTQLLVDGLPVNNAQQGGVDLSRYSLQELSGLSLSVGDASQLLTPVRSLGAATLMLETQSVPTQVELVQSQWNGWAPSLSYHRRVAESSGHPSVLSAAGRYAYSDNNYPYELGGQTFRRYNSKLSSGSMRLASQTQFNGRGVLRSSVRYWQSNRQLPGPVIYYNPTYGTEQLRDQETNLSLRWQSLMTGRLIHYVACRYSRQKSHYTNLSTAPMGPSEQRYQQQEAYASGGLQYRLTQWAQCSYAADYTWQSFCSNLMLTPSATRHTLQQALSFRAQGIGSWTPTVTLRVIDHLIFNDAAVAEAAGHQHRVTPSVSLGLQHRVGAVERNRVTAYIYYKEYFRPPTFVENYYYHMGTPSLRPETTRQEGLTLLWDIQPSTRLSWVCKLDGYLGQVRDRIVSVPINLFVWRTLNREHVRTAGLELSAQLRWQCASSLTSPLLNLSGSYTLQQAQSSGWQQPYTPLHSGAFSLGCEHALLSGALSLTASGERTTTLTPSVPSSILPAYYEINLSLWHTFRLRLPLRLRADVLNLTNHRHCIIARYPLPGISYRLSLALQIP